MRSMSSEDMNRSQPTYVARVRYDETTSERYQLRNPRRHRAEMQLIARVFADVPRGSLLDIPSGGGRVGLFLAQQGHQVTCADYSQAMVDITRREADRAGLGIAVDRQDIEAMTYADGAFDTVVCFRLFHHFPDRAIRARSVKEMCRVARNRVVLSYFSPFAFSALERKVRGLIKGRQSKFATSLGEVRGYFEACDFELGRDFGLIPLVQTLHVARFRRRGAQE
jgi:2-polyprenyl-3-methyl-5-hydroxy-6-metoxy-1,4-benzoquinol methylase